MKLTLKGNIKEQIKAYQKAAGPGSPPPYNRRGRKNCAYLRSMEKAVLAAEQALSDPKVASSKGYTEAARQAVFAAADALRTRQNKDTSSPSNA